MKFVSLVVATIIISFSASAQTNSGATDKTSIVKVHKAKKQKPKSAKTKLLAAKSTDVVTLSNESSHKAKWTFEEMLKRRQEIDAKEKEERKVN